VPTPYFEKIPVIGYDIAGDGERRVAVNLLQRVKIREILKQSYLIFYEYDVKDGETPEIIADKLYGTSQYHWIVLLANDIVDPYYDWPMSYENLIATIRKKYGTPTQDGLRFAYQTIHHYEDKFGVEIDETTYLSLPDAERTAVSLYDFEMNDNERKRRIRLLDKLYVDQIEQEMNDIMKRRLV
jgi:hypothetical protein